MDERGAPLKIAAKWKNSDARFWYGERGFGKCDWQRYTWWRRTGNVAAARGLTSAVVSQMELFGAGGSGRVLFEIGAACKSSLSMQLFSKNWNDEIAVAALRAVELHDEWTLVARNAILLWCWGAKKYLVKDIRTVIAKRVWKHRGAWSESIRPLLKRRKKGE
jgi:hypothetical protein